MSLHVVATCSYVARRVPRWYMYVYMYPCIEECLYLVVLNLFSSYHCSFYFPSILGLIDNRFHWRCVVTAVDKPLHPMKPTRSTN